MGEAKRKSLANELAFNSVEDLCARAPELIDREVKQVGRCLYLAQLLHMNFASLHLVLDSGRDKYVEEGVQYVDPHGHMTLGQLYGALLMRKFLPPDKKYCFEKALVVRNSLAHEKFNQMPIELLMLTPEGRKKANIRYRNYFATLVRANIACAELVTSAVNQSGERKLRQVLGGMMAKLIPSTNNKNFKPILFELGAILGMARFIDMGLMLIHALHDKANDSEIKYLRDHPSTDMGAGELFIWLKRTRDITQNEQNIIKEGISARNKFLHYPWHVYSGTIDTLPTIAEIYRDLQTIKQKIMHAAELINDRFLPVNARSDDDLISRIQRRHDNTISVRAS